MFYQGQMMNQNSCGCESSCPNAVPTYQQCNQVVQTYNVEDVPHYTNYHTHIINNCIKRHINVPTYSQSAENVLINEYAQAAPMYNQGMMYNQPMMPNQQGMMYNPNQYQGNVGTEEFQQPMQNPYQNMMNNMNPFNN